MKAGKKVAKEQQEPNVQVAVDRHGEVKIKLNRERLSMWSKEPVIMGPQQAPRNGR
jgi:hypothetical protein